MESNIDQSYYMLGRVVHLLEDMSSIPHVHRDAHISDSYEDGVGREYVRGNPASEDENERSPEILWGFEEDELEGLCIDFNLAPNLNISYTNGSLYRYTPSDKNQDKFKEDEKTFFTPKAEWDEHFENSEWALSDQEGIPPDEKWKTMPSLFHLFYSMAETTDNYPSNDYSGDRIPRLTNSGNEWIDIKVDGKKNWEHAADDIMPKMMSHVAGLYRLFWVSTHFPQNIDINNQYTDYLEDKVGTSTIADEMRKTYAEAFNADTPVYLGSPTGDCLVQKHNFGNAEFYYRLYSQGGLFYNTTKGCLYFGKVFDQGTYKGRFYYNKDSNKYYELVSERKI